MPKNHFSVKRINRSHISNIVDVIRVIVASVPRKENSISEMQERIRCPRSIMWSQVNSRNSCRHRRHCRRHHRRLYIAQPLLSDKSRLQTCRAFYLCVRPTCMQVKYPEEYWQTADHTFSPRRSCTHNSCRHRHFSSTRKRRELVTKAWEFIIMRHSVRTICMCISLTWSFNHLSAGSRGCKDYGGKRRLLKFQMINFKKLEGVEQPVGIVLVISMNNSFMS